MMKKLIQMLLLLGAVGFAACDKNENPYDDWIWDFSPIVFDVYVQNAKGADLLNPGTEGNILDKDIRAFYEGEFYERDTHFSEETNPTRAYHAHFKGLQTHKDQNGKYYLTFGEFDGTDNVDNRSVAIDWGDGTQDVFHYSNKLTWKKNEPIIDRKFFLNGVQQMPLSDFINVDFVITK